MSGKIGDWSNEDLVSQFESTCYDRRVDYLVREELLRRLSAAPAGAQARPRCDYTGHLCLDPTQVCRCYTCQNFAIAQFFFSPSAPQASKPSCHICGEGMDKGFICGKCGTHTGVAQAAPAVERVSSPRSAEALAQEIAEKLVSLHLYVHQGLGVAIEEYRKAVLEILQPAALAGQPNPAPHGDESCKHCHRPIITSSIRPLGWQHVIGGDALIGGKHQAEPESGPFQPSEGLEQVEHQGISLATRIVLAAHKAFEEAILHKDPVFRFSEADIESYLQAVPAREEESAK